MTEVRLVTGIIHVDGTLGPGESNMTECGHREGNGPETRGEAEANHSHGQQAGHGHSHDRRDASRRRLVIALALVSGYMGVEIAAGILSGSLALLADAAHMLTDAAAIGLALFAMWIATRPASIQRTFGYYRTEVLAALFNALSLWLIAAWIFVEAFRRFRDVPEVEGGIVLIAGAVGLGVNLIAVWILRRSAGHSLNVEGAFQHLLADLMGSIGVVVSGILTLAFGWWIADPILGALIGVLILISSWPLMVKVFQVLLEGAAAHLDMSRLCSELEDVEGVTQVHDIHAWTITSGYESFSAHVLIDPDYLGEMETLRRRMQQIAYQDFGIAHVTIQMEQSLDGCAERHHFDHLTAR